jgi:antitoxin component YwqK of YwqJK toxin-antitoxin module
MNTSMKPIIILIAAILVACNNPTGQQSVNKSESSNDSGFTNKAEAKNLMVNGAKEGKWVEYIDTNYKVVSDSNAPYYSLTMYKAGKEYGIRHGYYKSGKLLFETPYVDGKVNGVDKGYYENGTLMYEATNTNGKLNGLYKDYYKNGKLETEAPFKNDSENGIEKDYDTNGILEQETPVAWSTEDSININGIQKGYYESGKLKYETTYANGVKGATKSYDENGKEIR